MYNKLIVFLTSIGAVICATEDVFVETAEGPLSLNSFTVYDEFAIYNEKFIGQNSQRAIYFLSDYSKVPLSQLLSNMRTFDFILIQILHLLYTKNVIFLPYLLDTSIVFQDTESNLGENNSIRQNIEFPSNISFQVVKSLVTLDSKGIVKFPSLILEEILSILDTQTVLDAAGGMGDIEVIKWILKFDIQFDHLDELMNSILASDRIDVVKALIGKGALDKLPKQGKVTDLMSPKQESLLHLAAESHRPAAVATLLEAGLDPNHPDVDGRTPLHRAVLASDEEAVALLVKGGANLNQTTTSGDLPLHIAVAMGDLIMTKLLMKLGSSLDTKNNLGFTPLYVAENMIVSAIVRYMEDISWRQKRNESRYCRESTNIKEKCGDGHRSSPLNSIYSEDMNSFLNTLSMREIFCGANDIPYLITLSEIANHFIRKGEVTRMDSHLQLLLRMKVYNIDNKDLAEILINLGYDTSIPNIDPILDELGDLNAAFMSFDENVKFKNETGHTNLHNSAFEDDLKSVKALVSRGADIEARTNDGWTPLHFAAAQGNDDIVIFLIQKNASINAKTSNQETPLHLASANDHAQVAKTLLEYGADINAEMNPDCMTPLYVASREGHLEVVELLVEEDALVNARDCGSYNLTPFQIAANNGRISVVRYLGFHGADIDVRDNLGCTALYTAAWNGMEEMVRTLREIGADVRLRVGDAGLTALHAAAWRGHARVAEVLVQERVEPDIKDRNRATPLHWATTLDVTKVLLNHGAYVNAKNVAKETPLHRACARGYADVAKQLILSGADVDAKTINGKTPAYEAIFHNQYLTLKVLVESGANLYMIGPNGQTILNFGISKGMFKSNSG